MAESFDAVIVFCGNNDLGNHPRKSWLRAEPTMQVASSLERFKSSLLERNPAVRVLIIRLLPRPDVDTSLISETNKLLTKTMPDCSANPEKIISLYDFEGDNKHLKSSGIKIV